MNRLGLLIISLIITVAIIMLWFKPRKTLSSLRTTLCVCTVDNNWDSEYQKKIVKIIKESYSNNCNSQEIIEKTLKDFPEIKDMKAEICGADSICFYASGLKPVFILDDSRVVIEDGAVFEKQHFEQNVIDLLPRIVSKKLDQVIDMINFIQLLPHEVFNDYVITWHDKNNIVLQLKKYENMRCLLSDLLIPSEKILRECTFLYDTSLAKLPKKKQKNYMIEYDIRFKNQIIVRSWGNYG